MVKEEIEKKSFPPPLVDLSSPGRLRPSFGFLKSQLRRRKPPRTLLSIATVLIFLLLVSVAFGIKKREAEQRSRKAEAFRVQIERKLEEGKGLGVLKPAEAKKAFKEAQELLNEAKSLKVGSGELKMLEKEIETEMRKVEREFKLSSVPLFLDLSLVQEGAQGDDFGLFGDNLVVLDKEGKRLIGIDLEKKSFRILAGGEDLKGATEVAVWDDKAYVLSQNGILEVPLQTTNYKLRIPKDEAWGEIADLAIYTGNLYLLDKKNRTIWRYLVSESGFGGRQDWLKGSAPDLAKAVSFAIDGSIWVAQQDSSIPILKFTSGKREAFSIQGLERPLILPTRIYTNDLSKNIYLLDNGNYQIVVLDKEGNYQASYLWTGIEKVEDIVVSEEAKKILLLAGSKIYEVEIK